MHARPARVQYERHPGAAGAPLGSGYRRREPETTVLHAIVRDHLETFLAEPLQHDGDGYPVFLEREFRPYLDSRDTTSTPGKTTAVFMASRISWRAFSARANVHEYPR